MHYFLDLFSPATYEAFKRSPQNVSGFRRRHHAIATRVKPGDRLMCYMTKLSRWFGVLEVLEGPFEDDSALFTPDDDPFVIRFRVKPLVLLDVERAIPIRDPEVWRTLSFTREVEPHSPAWTGKLRGSLVRLDESDGRFLEELLRRQQDDPRSFPFDESAYQRHLAQPTVRRTDKKVVVTVPDDAESTHEEAPEAPLRESHHIQAILAAIGSRMGMKVWIPRNDRGPVLREWQDDTGALIDELPLNYDDTTLKTIEQIDVLWVHRRAIVRAFEVEHTTSIYSGILRMADLIALQPNLDIKLHLVAPADRRDKVFHEMRRPVFSLLDPKPLAEVCTYLSYDSVEELMKQPHLQHAKDTVLEEFAEDIE